MVVSVWEVDPDSTVDGSQDLLSLPSIMRLLKHCSPRERSKFRTQSTVSSAHILFIYQEILSRLAIDQPISSPTDAMQNVGYRATGEEVWETHSQSPILPERGDVLLLQPWR